MSSIRHKGTQKGEMWQRNQTSLADFILEDPPLHTPMYLLLSQLSVMDLMYVFTTVPKMATNYLSGKKSISFAGCVTQHFLYLSVAGAECLLLALMSYDRYVAICHPLHYTVLMNRRVGPMMAVMSWLGSSINSLFHTVSLMHFRFCGPLKSHPFYCEFPAVVKLVRGDITAYETTVCVSSVLLLLLPSFQFVHPASSSSIVSLRCIQLGVREMPLPLGALTSLWFPSGLVPTYSHI
uniref:G-protein coupled receptors family 1 profile domain-containing protein n=1 Tax=Equus caballus TaxID=9796 RepID=A0A5F5PIH6_HORSE